jgi:hypothetical protein
MASYSTIIDVKDGRAHVSTKSRWMFVLSMPHTGVLPHPCSAVDVKRLGTVIKWTTDDPAVLKKMHEAIVRVVQDIGVGGFFYAAQVAKTRKQVYGHSWLQDMVQLATWGEFPTPADVVKLIKGFQ